MWSQLSDELFTEMDWDCDGVVTEEELITAFLRKVHHFQNDSVHCFYHFYAHCHSQEQLTCLLCNKLMQRFVSSSHCLKDAAAHKNLG